MRGGEEQQTGCRQQGCQKRGRKSGKAQHHLPRIHNPDAPPPPRVLSSSLPSPTPTPLLAPRKYFSLTLLESYQWQAGRRARERERERWWRSGRNRRLLRLPARSRRASEQARPWVLAAPSSPSAGGLPTSNRRCLVRAYRTLPLLLLPRILRVFSLSLSLLSLS